MNKLLAALLVGSILAVTPVRAEANPGLGYVGLAILYGTYKLLQAPICGMIAYGKTEEGYPGGSSAAWQDCFDDDRRMVSRELYDEEYAKQERHEGSVMEEDYETERERE